MFYSISSKNKLKSICVGWSSSLRWSSFTSRYKCTVNTGTIILVKPSGVTTSPHRSSQQPNGQQDRSLELLDKSREGREDSLLHNQLESQKHTYDLNHPSPSLYIQNSEISEFHTSQKLHTCDRKLFSFCRYLKPSSHRWIKDIHEAQIIQNVRLIEIKREIFSI